MYQLEEQIWFWALLVIPVVLALFLIVQLWKKQTQKKFADQKLLAKLSPNRSLLKSVLKIVVLCLAFACLAIALVNPKNWNQTRNC